MRRFGILVALSTVFPTWAASAVAAPVAYRPPVDAPIVDGFRPPATPYGPGNRGIDYDVGVSPASVPVHAVADGEVVFAGRVGTGLHVVVLHADGIRTSSSFLAGVTVRRGDQVAQGERLGTATGRFHFGARAGETYLDPLTLFGQVGGDAGRSAVLVADPDERRPLAEVEERRRLLDALRGVAGASIAGATDWLRDQAVAAAQRKVALAAILADTALDRALPLPARLALAALRWDEDQRTCTPVGTPIPPMQGRRIAILVGGLGSSTGHTAVLDVDTEALGYDRRDVHQFSYAADPSLPYGPADTLGDIGAAGRRLAVRIAAIGRLHPGVAIDVIAHSQGGLVARSAITTHVATPATVVTLGTPHQGADLASAGAALDATFSGHALLEAVGAVAPIDPTAISVGQMNEASTFLDDLPESGWSPSTSVVSIAARGDQIVPSHQSRLDPSQAWNTVVTTGFGVPTDDHTRLPGSAAATLEIGRAIHRQAPTCRSLPDALVDEALSRSAAGRQELVGTALAFAGLYVDARAQAAGLEAVRR